MRRLMLSAYGRIGRKDFWIGFVLLTLFIAGGNAILRAFSGSMPAFLIALFFPFISIYLILCVYGKRLHDMGRSAWWVASIIAIEFVVVIFVMLTFGGADYFSEFSQYSREETIDPDVSRQIIETYQARLRESYGIILPLLWAVPALFTLWVGLTPSQVDENRFGPPTP